MTFKELPVISAGPIVHSPKQNEPIIGIDLGTTNSLVAIVENGIPRIIETREGRSTLPSVVRIEKNEVVVGFAAKSVRTSNSSNTIYSVKRLLGRGLSDIAEIKDQLPYDLDGSDASNVKIKVNNKSYTPIEISAMILQELKSSAEENLGRPIEDAVITVPAYFNDSQRQATRAAGRLAGLNVLRIVNEPTAAALAYGIHQKRTGLIAVYDFGGGTFDISILKLRDGIFEVLSTNGNTQLGGDDLDHLIAAYLENKYGISIKSVQERSSLIEKAEKLKVALSEKDEASLDSLSLNRKELESIALPLLEQSRKPCLDALKDAGINKSDLTDVVLVGGPTRLGVIQDFVEKLFDRKPNASLHPDEVVAAGAAVQADILAGNNRDFLLLDVVPLSLGIETFGGTMNKLIPRNTRIPTLAKEQFTTYVEGQTKVAINVYQGERELVADNRKLAEFILSGIPPLPAGVARIEVTFLVDADGILSVSAKEIYSEIEAAIEVKPTYGLTDEEVERMLEDGLMNFESDAKLKRLVDAKNDARAVLVATEKSLPALKDKLDTSELEKINALVNRMNDALKGEDYNEVKAAHKALDAGTTKMAELLMNETISKDLKNKNASDFIRK